ncbi:probable E3 ubiquitin-protein ligase TRIML1 [Solea solea]|uniref:probable E3 ubiquitin-protein ligase TRIML1 n=1 Tax=Solea solea TaxID=90069 RepID=UPI00272C7F1E|nr:probable E3 ubiquitin-protein ligase TRIML1 [Solea solea]
MASSLHLLSMEQFLCPICLDTITQPVTTPCGHNFCMSCLTTHWNSNPVCRCPMCQETFERRPNLKVNTFISELASQFTLLHMTDANICSPAQPKDNSGCAVLCDVCTETQHEAVKSCLECQTSYCSDHLEPHRRAAGLRRHTLVDPVVSLEDRICKEHNHFFAMFCTDDNVLLCDICATLLHVNHNVVSVQQAHDDMKGQLRDKEIIVQEMIKKRQQNVSAVKESLNQSKIETTDVIDDSVQDFTALVSEIQKSQAELVKVIEEKQKAEEEEAEELISRMEQEVIELQRKQVELMELRQTEDQLSFLQNFPHSSPTFLMDLSKVNRTMEIRHMQKYLSSSTSQLRRLLNKMTTDINTFSVSNVAALRYLQQFEQNIELDRDTAHPRLILSDDRKQVRFNMGQVLKRIQDLKPTMFMKHLAVMGNRGYSSGKFYFEVSVSQKTEWSLGIATASIQRRGILARSPHSGLWAMRFLKDRFEVFSYPGEIVYLGKTERIGVFVDFEEGDVSFYDVQTATLIYSFTECVFNEKLYPYFNPCDNEYGSNLAPLVIVPVSRTLD